MSGRGRGGYCMENSIFYHHVLKALGFKMYMAGVKIRLRDLETKIPSGDYIGWVHIVNIVTLPSRTCPSGSQKDMVDIGFGGDGATLPVPLDPSASPSPLPNLGAQQIRLLHAHVPGQTDLSLPKRWVYQYRNDVAAEWNSFYAFPELEFMQADFEVMSYFTSTSERSMQTYTPLVIKFLRGPPVADAAVGAFSHAADVEPASPAATVVETVAACDEKIVGKLMLVHGVVKRNLGGKTEVVAECRTEAERIQALKMWFGIELLEEERLGIKDRAACLALD